MALTNGKKRTMVTFRQCSSEMTCQTMEVTAATCSVGGWRTHPRMYIITDQLRWTGDAWQLWKAQKCTLLGTRFSFSLYIVDYSWRRRVAIWITLFCSWTIPRWESKGLRNQYYKNMIPEIAISLCPNCNHFLHQVLWRAGGAGAPPPACARCIRVEYILIEMCLQFNP